ncbi:MAG TPA: beta-L-arabinofuranosidase domain-containing protein [Armatimonadota bacterium]|nr:beta-L-arabinofuranosidase domain-containing protein [Armatimonadota bacterium]
MPSVAEAAPPASVVVDTSASPHARLRPLPLSAVRLSDTFWEPRRRVNQRVTLPSQYRRCEETGRIDNFRRAAGKKQLPFQGRYYNDSDVYKWVEACAFVLAAGSDPELERMVDTVVREIADAQEPDGYLNTYFTFERAGERWSNLKDLHELYCAGHLIQAAVAHHRCTGHRELLDVALRCADHICSVFGAEGREGTCGHQELEMALVELYRLTGRETYLEQARLFIERRGRKPPVIGGSPYHQDHAPFRTLDAVVGHAVRMVYYCCGGADVYAESGEPEYLAALERLWSNMVHRRMCVTGGIGSRYEGEAFGGDWELPNDRAYAESCAAIGSVMWNWRMLSLTGEARFADVLENALYNGMLPSLSLEGHDYFYQNPLADRGGHRRQPWFECACCPPNIARMLASLPGYFYSTSEEGVWVHLYGRSSATAALPDGRSVTLVQKTNYPWNGDIEIEVETDAVGPFSLFLRIPGWCEGAWAAVNGETVATDAAPDSYAEIRREWRTGDALRLSLPMPVTRVRSHPYVTNNAGRVALRRGPLVYCIEQTDLHGVDPRDVVLPAGSELSAAWEPDLLGGIVTLRGPATARDHAAAWNGDLYRTDAEAPPAERAIELTAIPYYAWANREPGGMAVWIESASGEHPH